MNKKTEPVNLFNLSDAQLQGYAGKAAFERGRIYAQQGKVRITKSSARMIEASVRGTDTYDVLLQLTGEELYGACNCPVGDQGDFCKHQVAVALSVRGDAPASADTGNDLMTFLHAQPAQTLAKKLLSYANQFKEVEKDLAFWHKSSLASSTAELTKVIGGLLRCGSFVDYRQSFDYAHRVRQVAGLLDGLAQAQPARCAEASEYALLRLFKVLEHCDDSAGVVGDAIAEIARLHCASFAASEASPKEKAQRYFKLARADGWDFVHLEDYRQALGNEALALYGGLLEKACAGLPARTTRDRHIITAEDSERSHLVYLLQAWYQGAGEVDALLALKARQLANAWDYCELVTLCTQHGRSKQALEWAEKGHGLFPEDARLCEALIACYVHDGYDEEAEKLIWQLFEKQPSVERYFWLLKQSKKVQAAAWRERAMNYLRECEERDWTRRKIRDPAALRNATTRIAILLHENQIEEAVAISAGAAMSENVAMQLAGKAEKTHAEVSIKIYRQKIPKQIELGNSAAYQKALELINQLLPLIPTNERNEFLNELRTRFKAKRNFIGLISQL